MNIAIIGASSGVGLVTVKQALAKGYKVTTLSRNTDTIPDHPSLVKIKGTATSVADIKKVTDGADAVIVTIGKSKDKMPTLFPDTADALVQAALNIPVIVITGFGAGDSLRYSNSLFIKFIIGVLLKKEYAYKTQLENILAQSKLKWEIVRPGMLTDGPFTGVYQAAPELFKDVREISRADVADYLLNQAVNPSMLYKYVTLTY